MALQPFKMSSRSGQTWWKLSYFLEGIQMCASKMQTFPKSVSLLVWIDSSCSVAAGRVILDREFPSQAGPPPGTSEQQVPPYLPTLQSPEQDTTHLHTCNGLLSAPPDWGSPLAGAPRPCSIESSPLESKEVFRGCTENLLSVRNGASLLPTSVIQFQRSILIWDEIR